MQRLGVHRERGEQHVVGLSDGAARAVLVQHAGLELLEPQATLDYDFLDGFLSAHSGRMVRSAHRGRIVRSAHRPVSRAITINCTSVVPSPISRILLSR